MEVLQSKRLPLLIVLAILLFNAIAIWPDLRMGDLSNGDTVSHLELIRGMADALEHGRNPLDFWSPWSAFGYPEIRTYQPLAHALVVLVYFALGKSVPLITVFSWVQYLLIVLLPASFFAAAALIGLSPLTAAVVAGLAPLIATHSLYGIEYQSFVWSGFGLFPQLLGVHLLLLAIGFGYRAIREGRRLVLTGFLLGLTALAHLVYGYIGALTLCLIALLPQAMSPLMQRICRTVWIGLVAALLSFFQLLPLWLDRAIINHSNMEPAWKWNSWGAGQVLKWLFTGGLLDDMRLPVLSLLVLAGVIVIVWQHRRNGHMAPTHVFVLSGSILWILLLFGRPTWGPLLWLFGISPDMPIHRLIGGVHIFLILTAAIGLTALCNAARRRWGVWAAAATLLIVVPAVVNRVQYLKYNAFADNQNLAAYSRQRAALTTSILSLQQRGGRTYAGFWNWGRMFTMNSVRIANILGANQIPTVSYLAHTMALPMDLLPLFDELRESHYRLFDIRSVMTPSWLRAPLPKFLTPRLEVGNYVLIDAPGDGLFDVVDAPVVVRTDKQSFFRVNSAWFKSQWPDHYVHLWLDFFGNAPSSLPHSPADGSLPAIPFPTTSPGRVITAGQQEDVYEADVEATRPSFALFKMTWHPNWKAVVDGKPVATVMLSPGFVGVPLTSGRHQIRCEYEPGNWKLPVGLAGLFSVFLLGVAERLGYLPFVRTHVGMEPTVAVEPLMVRFESSQVAPVKTPRASARQKKRRTSAK